MLHTWNIALLIHHSWSCPERKLRTAGGYQQNLRTLLEPYKMGTMGVEDGVMSSYEETGMGSSPIVNEESCTYATCSSPSKSYPFVSSVYAERAPASTSDSSCSFPLESANSQVATSFTTDSFSVIPACHKCIRGLPSPIPVDKPPAASVDYWQRRAAELHAENERLRELLQVTKVPAVQDVLTHLFVEKVQDVPAQESILENPTPRSEDATGQKFSESRIYASPRRNLAMTSFGQPDLAEGADRRLVMTPTDLKKTEHFQGLDRVNADEVLDRTYHIELLLQMVLKDVPVIISHCDKDLCYTYVKFIDQPLTGILAEDMKGKNDIVLAGLIPGALETMQIKREVLDSGIAQGKELTLNMDSTGKRWLVVTCEPLRSKAGHILGVITAVLDVTEQALVREKLAQMREEMAVWEATEKELRRAIEMADEAMEAKNNFLAVMSHEIRTPLNGVLGMAQVLATTPLDPEQKELVAAMVFSADVLLAIISDILDLSKVEAGTMKLEERELNPRDIVKHVVRTATVASKDRGLSIQAEIADDVPNMVLGDPLRMKQVITNLVFNAVKFTKKGHVKLRLRVFKPEQSTVESFKSCRFEDTDGDTEKVERTAPGLLSGAPPLTKLSGRVSEEKWDPLMEGGRREIPELSMAADDIEDTCEVRSEAKEGAIQHNHLVKMHSAGELSLNLLRDSHTQVIKSKKSLSEIQTARSIFSSSTTKATEIVEVSQKPASDDEQLSRDLWLQFQIEDTGIGIPKEAFPTLFEKFTQVHSSTTRKYGGTGLGLAICKQLVALMGGQISVISKVGKGSTFTFTVQCKQPSLVKGGPSVIKLVSETKMKKNLSNSTAHVHKLQAGMSYPSSKSRKASSQTSNKVLEEEREARTALAEVTSPKFSSKLPRNSLKLLKWNDCACNGSLGGSREKSKSWEQEMYVYTTSWAARQGGLKENNSGDRCGVLQETFRGGLRRTSSGPSRFECLMMADLDHSKSMPAIPLTAPTVDKKLPSLLLAEDNKVNVMVALSMLKKLGLVADVAYNGLEAIKALQAKYYDLVLMDICMPVMDGLEVTRRIRRFEHLGFWEEESTLKPSANIGSKAPPLEDLSLEISSLEQSSQHERCMKRLPIVAMTANALSDCEKQCSAIGMDGFMTKPVTFKKLKDVLALHLPHKSSNFP